MLLNLTYNVCFPPYGWSNMKIAKSKSPRIVALSCLKNTWFYFFIFSFFRMSPERLEHLLDLVWPFIQKRGTNLRATIPEAERLVLTIWFLASGDSKISLSYLFQMRKSVSRTVSEISKAIVQVLLQDMSPSETKEQWKNITQEFVDLW